MTRGPVPPKTRGLCGICYGDYEVRKSGKLPKHGPRYEPHCPNSEKWPQAYRAPGGKWKARQA